MKKVKNDRIALTVELGLDKDTLKHIGNYRFEAKRNGEEVEILTHPIDEEGNEIEIRGLWIGGEEYEECTMCHELYPVSELHEEADMGCLCERCVRGIKSRGENLTLID